MLSIASWSVLLFVTGCLFREDGRVWGRVGEGKGIRIYIVRAIVLLIVPTACQSDHFSLDTSSTLTYP